MHCVGLWIKTLRAKTRDLSYIIAIIIGKELITKLEGEKKRG